MYMCMYSPIRNLAILADFVCIPTLNSHHSRDGGSVRGVRDNANVGIMHTIFIMIARFRIREYLNIIIFLSIDVHVYAYVKITIFKY